MPLEAGSAMLAARCRSPAAPRSQAATSPAGTRSHGALAFAEAGTAELRA